MEPARSTPQVFTVVEGGSPGQMLRTARERMGLSVDDVCVRLKMMPTQVKAMESDSLEGLPPGGYARAFIKGYARFLNLDADQIVGSMVSLTGNKSELTGPPPIQVAPHVAAQRQADAEEEESEYRSRRETVSVQHNFGQLSTEPAGDGKLVKYSLVALALGLLIYVLVPGTQNNAKREELAVTSVQPYGNGSTPAPVVAEKIPAGQPGATTGTGGEPAFPPGTVMVPAQTVEQPAVGVVVSPAPAATTAPIPSSAPTQVPKQTPVPAPVPAAPQAAVSTPNAVASIPSAPAPVATSRPAPVVAPTSGPQRVRMVFSDRAYVTIRDRDGNVLMAQLNAANTEQSVEGNPPFKVIIGNARAVRMEFRGRPFDLGPHTKDDVARFVMD